MSYQHDEEDNLLPKSFENTEGTRSALESERTQNSKRFPVGMSIAVVGLFSLVLLVGISTLDFSAESSSSTTYKMSAASSSSSSSSSSLSSFSSSSLSSSSTENVQLKNEPKLRNFGGILDNDTLTGVKPYSLLDKETKKRLFESFIEEFDKTYETKTDEINRFANFELFLETLDERNTKERNFGGTATHGITKFADLTHEEFKNTYLGFRPLLSYASAYENFKVAPYKGDLTMVDWSGIYTTAVKNQGYCGSCWAFSATEQIESDSIRLGLLNPMDELAVQQIVSCDESDLGCNGGNTETAYQYVMTAGGLTTGVDYPYTSFAGDSNTCLFGSKSSTTTTTSSSSSSSLSAIVTVKSVWSVQEGTSAATELAMMDYVMKTGPLSICLDASTWSSYSSGVLASCGVSVDHCVQVVGLDSEKGYWIVRNSWGTDWGEEGYIYLKAGDNTCYLTYDPTFTITSVVE